MAAPDDDDLEVSLRNLIAQQSAMIDELRVSNARDMERQKVGRTTTAFVCDDESSFAAGQPPLVGPC
jgi:hypothetical protein